MQLSARNVDKKVFREFKTRAVEEGVPLGTALTLAMEEWVSKKGAKKRKFPEVKPWNWGPGTEKTSKEVDKMLYG